jgi:hypothetical protein
LVVANSLPTSSQKYFAACQKIIAFRKRPLSAFDVESGRAGQDSYFRSIVEVKCGTWNPHVRAFEVSHAGWLRPQEI